MKIADLIGSAKVHALNQSAVLIQMANVMKCTTDEVREKVDQYGGGWIYTPGLILHDTPAHRQKLTDMYGEIVIILTDGTVILRDKTCTGLVGKRKTARKIREERNLRRREIEAYHEERKRERMFRQCQTKPSPKRQGQCKGIPCVYHPENTWTREIPRAVDKFRVIHIKI